MISLIKIWIKKFLREVDFWLYNFSLRFNPWSPDTPQVLLWVFSKKNFVFLTLILHEYWLGFSQQCFNIEFNSCRTVSDQKTNDSVSWVLTRIVWRSRETFLTLIRLDFQTRTSQQLQIRFLPSYCQMHICFSYRTVFDGKLSSVASDLILLLQNYPKTFKILNWFDLQTRFFFKIYRLDVIHRGLNWPTFTHGGFLGSKVLDFVTI